MTGRLENLSHGVSLSKLPIFFIFSADFDFLVDLRVIFEQIFFISKRFRCCTSKIQISLLFRQRLKLRSGFFFFLTPYLLISFFIFLLFIDW